MINNKKKVFCRKKILFMGYGNMTQKYLKILKKILPNATVKFYSSRKIKNNLYKNIAGVKVFDPNIIFICSSTYEHFNHLELVNKLFKNKLILIEKPLFHQLKKIKLKNKVYVGYNLRYDPIIQYLKKLVKNQKFWSVEVFCNSYMPRWRKRSYLKTYSAKKKLGGGVLLDLSHELDYLLWFFKKLNIKYVVNNKISDLKIDTDDNLLIVGKSKNVKQIILHLNYYSKISARFINLIGPKINIRADLIKKELDIMKNGKQIFKNWKEKKFTKTFERQIKSFVKNKNILSASYNEGIKILKIIEKIKSF